MNDTPSESQSEEQKPAEESPVLAAARQYFMELAKNSDAIRQEMLSAKTRTKKAYLNKKLQRNNNEAIGLLQRINALDQAKAQAVTDAQEPQQQEHVDDEYR